MMIVSGGPWSFDFSVNITQAATRLLMFIDKIASLGIITPKKPWARYLGY